MILFVSLLPALMGATGQIAFEQVRTTFVQNEFIIRVPARPRVSTGRLAWAEEGGPKCIAGRAIRGALLSGTEHVDFVMAGRHRVRAKFEGNCPALDFYEGFYLNSPDRMICAGRDSIRSRMGGSCSIESFAHLVPVRRAALP